MTADAAVSGIREVDATGSIGLLSAEPDPPYDRPPLSKSLWKGKPLESVWRHTEDRKVDLHLGTTATAIDAQRKEVADDKNEVYAFDKLLLATGGSTRRLRFGGDDIIYFRSLGDYRRLRDLTTEGKRFAVIGGGFIGSELAVALAMNHKEVTVLFPRRGVCDRMFPPDLSEFLNDFYRQKGVELWNGESATGLERRGGQLVLRRKASANWRLMGLLPALATSPTSTWPGSARLETDDGIVVNESCRTSKPDIYAAGDVALFQQSGP